MSVYVDGIIEHGVTVGSIRGRSCHLLADTPEELHAFALKPIKHGGLGLRREWASDVTQPKSVLHYDLTPSKRALAVRLGAVEVAKREMVEIARRNRARKAEA